MRQCLEFPGVEFLSVCAAGGTGDGFIHQCAAEVVGPGIQAQCGAARAHFHPRGLNVPDQGMQRQSGYRVHEYSFAECRTRAGASFAPERGFHMDVPQWHKLRDPSSARL